MITRAISSTLLAIALAWAHPAFANKLIDLGVKENYERAELVVIGKITSSDEAYRSDLSQDRAATVEIEVVLKGQEKARAIKVVYDVGISELSFQCCQVGRKYLFFLRASPVDGAYFSYDGKHGVFLLEEDLMGG